MFGNVNLLNEGDIAGPETFNTLARAIRNMRSLHDGLIITMGPDGGLQFDMAMFSLAELMAIGAFACSCGGTLSKGKLTVSGGSVLWPGGSALSASGITVNNVTSGRKVWCAVSYNSASLSSGTSFPAYVTGSGQGSVINVRILEVVTLNSRLAVKYHHCGDIQFPFPPYFWIAGFDDSQKQSLDHGVGGSLEWTDYDEWECNP